jgi:hypothetical protein
MLIGLPLPISVPAAAPPLLVAALAYLRPKRAVQGCEVDQIGAITLTRGNVRIPFDLNHYRYIRMHQNSSGTLNYPSMMVLYRDTVPSVSTWLGSVLFPRVDDERVILFFNRWHTADGYFVGPGTLGALFYQACVRAGRTPIERGDGGWEVRRNDAPAEPAKDDPVGRLWFPQNRGGIDYEEWSCEFVALTKRSGLPSRACQRRNVAGSLGRSGNPWRHNGSGSAVSGSKPAGRGSKVVTTAQLGYFVDVIPERIAWCWTRFLLPSAAASAETS